MRIHLSLFIDLYLLYLLLNSCDGNDATPATKQRLIEHGEVHCGAKNAPFYFFAITLSNHTVF